MRKKFWIYKITNSVTGKFYIGQTNDIYKRKSAHKRAKDPDTHISRSILKYGWINHKIDILFYCENISIELANEIERHFIQRLKSCTLVNKNGMNMNMGGMQGLQTKEHLDKMVHSKFMGWKRKIGMEDKGIEIFTIDGKYLFTHFSTPSELLIRLSIPYSEGNVKSVARNLTKGGLTFYRKYIIQWEGDNKCDRYFKSKSDRIELLKKAPLTEKRLMALKSFNPKLKIA